MGPLKAGKFHLQMNINSFGETHTTLSHHSQTHSRSHTIPHNSSGRISTARLTAGVKVSSSSSPLGCSWLLLQIEALATMDYESWTLGRYMPPPCCLWASRTEGSLPSFLLYPSGTSSSGHLLGFVRNRGPHGNGACSPVYPHFYYVMDKGCFPKVARHGHDQLLVEMEMIP